MSTLSKITENQWVSKQAAAQYLNVSEKTLDRLVARGQLQRGRQRRPGQPTISTYRADDLERYATSRATAFPMPTTALTAREGPNAPALLTDTLTRLGEVLSGRVNPLTTLYISMAEAAARLGLNERYVRQCVREGKLRAVRLMVDGKRTTKVRAADLECV